MHALTWAFNHFVFEGLTVFLLQKGAGSRAIAHAFKISVVWAALTLALQFLVFWKGFPSTASHTLQIAWEIVLCGFYVLLLYRRGVVTEATASPALRGYWVVLRFLYIVADASRYSSAVSGAQDGAYSNAGVCLYMLIDALLFGLLYPLVVLHTLQRDSEYWRGHRKRRGSASMRGRRKSVLQRMKRGKSTSKGLVPGSQRLDGLLVGRLSLNEDSAMALAETMDSIEADSEYVQLLNFAYLSIDQRKVLGQGGTARVYAIGRTRRSRPRWSTHPSSPLRR